MRDPARIDKVLAKLRKLWYRMPDLRFWQLILYVKEQMPQEKDGRDPFYYEEHTWLEAIDNVLISLDSFEDRAQ